MKKLLAVFLAAAMLLCAAPLTGFLSVDLAGGFGGLFPGADAAVVANGNCGDRGGNVTWTLDDAGTLTVSGTGKMKNYDYQYNEAFEMETSAPWVGRSIRTVVIQSGVTSVGDYAFYRIGDITKVTLADSVTAIGRDAFGECVGLKSLAIPGGVTQIAWYAFEGCGLTSLTIPEGVTEIGGSAFSGCAGLTSVTIPEGVAEIGGSAFSGCTGLTSASIGSGVRYMGGGVFSDCPKLKTITVSKENVDFYSVNNCVIEKQDKTLVIGCQSSVIPTDGSVTGIGESAFAGSGLTKMTIPGTVTQIGGFAFAGCSSLTSLTIPDSVTEIGSSTFEDCSGLTKVTIPDSVTKIGFSAFEGCSGLTSMTIPDSVTEIGGYAFSGCSGLTTVTISSGMTRLEDSLFYNCSSLQTVTIPSGVTSFGDGVFSGCSGLQAVTIPSGVTSLGNAAFSDCSSLQTVTIPGSVKTIEASAFSGCSSLLTVTIPSGVTSLGDYVFSGCSSLQTAAIPSSVTEIGKYAFDKCDGLTSVTLSDGMTGLSEGMFYDCSSLQTITIPSGVTSIPDWTFSGCSGMTSMTIPSGVTAIGEWAFSLCSSLTSVTIPSGVTSVGESAFAYCDHLQTVTLPESLTDIADFAFASCYELTDVYYSGTPTQWYAVNIGDGNNALLDAEAHFGGVQYTVSFDANGGAGAPAAQMKTEGNPLTISSAKPTKSYKITYNANGGTVSPASETVNCTFKNWNTKKDGSGTAYASGASYAKEANVTLYAQWTDPAAGTLALPSRSGYSFNGWFTAASGGKKVTDATVITADTTLYAQWTAVQKNTYTVQYDANGGSGAPAVQTKTEGKALTLSSTKPTRSFTITYNANGGSVSPGSKSVSCTFKSWNTKQDGSGTAYAPGASYAKEANVTLYAQWTNPTAGTLATPTRSGYTFNGWYTAASGGVKVTAASAVAVDTTLYAQWTLIQKNSFTVKFDANTGVGAPAAQTKTEGKALTLSSVKPVKTFKLTYNANGGSVSPASKTVSCTFNSWNTKQDGSGTSYVPGASYAKDANVTLYAQWTNPAAGSLPTPTRSGYTFEGWYTAASGGSKASASTVIAANTTLYAQWKKESGKTPFQWGADNWNFINSSYSGDFSAGTYRSQIDGGYLDVLSENLTNTEYQIIFNGTYYSGGAWLDGKFGGSCYGMSALTLLAKQGLMPFAEYQSGAKKLSDLDKPTANSKVSSLITYYQMLQIKDVIQQQYRTVPSLSNEENIKRIISLLDENATVLTGFKRNGWGAHAILAYDYEYGSYTYNGVTYQGCIKICDPNSANRDNPMCNIYFNTRTYNWAIPYYSMYGISSTNGARFTYVGAAVNEINEGGYLSGKTAYKTENYIARIDADEISDNRFVTKMQEDSAGGYQPMQAGPDDIVEDYSYIVGNESRGTVGYNLRDGNAAYMITQTESVPMQLTMDYEDCFLSGSSSAGQTITFNKSGFVEVTGESAAYTLSMTFDGEHPTDWFSVQAKGTGADKASLQKTKEGYVLSSDNLTDTEVRANNKTDSASLKFSTKYPSVLIYEVDKTTVGVKVDADNNGTYETVLKTENDGAKMGDVDGNGTITSGDARLALRASVGLEKDITKGTEAWQRCDVDNNGSVTSGDARLILRGSVGLEDTSKWKKN